jgi:protein-tyrosine phosphatase
MADKVLMVCLGNICRSPLAAGILEAQLKLLNIDTTVESAGFEPYHVGDNPDRRSQDIARLHGIDISQNIARLFRRDDFDRYDRIYVMDSNNYSDVKRMMRNEADRKKIDFIMNAVYPGTNTEVPDPYYGGADQFRLVYDMLEQACIKIAESFNNDTTP